MASPVDLRDQDAVFQVRDQLGALGSAFAHSSFDANGFVVKDGAQRTHQLSGLLASELGGRPERTFLAGHSLGGGIALSLTEKFPRQYDGALLLCGIVGGSLVETQYLGHVRALFDFFYPGALPGDVVSVPPGTVVTLQQVIAAVQGNPAGLFAIASTQQAPLPFVPLGDPTDPSSTAFQTLVGSLFGALSFQVRGAENLLDLTHGKLPFENAGTEYAVGTPLLPAPVVAQLLTAANAGVTRYSFDRAAENYLEHYFTPTGDLRIPVLTVHNTWDPAVPAFHEAVLLQKATAAGATDMLLQRLVPAFGHCAIPPELVVQSVTDLATWAATGTKPAS